MSKVFNPNLWVTGDMFLGREIEVEYLLRQIFRPALSGTTHYLALTGMKRIGKTSLVREAWRRFNQLEHKNVVVIDTSLDKYSRFWTYWVYGVVTPLYKKLRSEANLTPGDLDAIEDLFQFFFDKDNFEELINGNIGIIETAKNNLEELFCMLRELFEVHVILIMDEFDLARQVFGERTEYFGWFRSLLQKGGGLSVLTISRRSLEYIQLNQLGGSTLDGIFTKYGLFGFRNSEIDLYFQRLENYGRATTAEERKQIYHYCGRSPFYLAIMGNALLDIPGEFDFSIVANQFYSSFNDVNRLLKEEKLLRAMLQMFVGPRYNLLTDDIGKLESMGYCMTRKSLEIGSDGKEYEDYTQPEKTGIYLVVCQHFVEYLAGVYQREVDDLWPKLTRTEQIIRKMLEQVYRRISQQKAGTTWQQLIREDLINQSNPIVNKNKLDNFRKSFQSLYNKADLQQKQDVGNSDLNLISLQELGELVYLHWDRCFRYFNSSGYSRSDVRNIFATMKEARNPYAHSNAQLLSPADIAHVDQICDKLMKSILEEMERQAVRA